MGCKVGTQRTNTRNDVIKLRRLLTSACRTIDMFWPDQMDDDLRRWWQGEQLRRLEEQQNESDVGMIAMLVAGNDVSDEPTGAFDFRRRERELAERGWDE